jgi:FAD/FMN-containing dehydrogenase
MALCVSIADMTEPQIVVDRSAVARLRDEFAGQIVEPADPDYDAARAVWNGMVDRYPALVARCEATSDVISAVRFAREQDLVVAVRGGGHSMGGFSTCDGGIVIDTSRMHGARVDPDRRVARVKGGSLLGELDHEAQRFGMACPVGVVSHTGVAGLTLGGGMGRLQRKYGFTIDNLLSVDLVTADGREITVDEEENADLFWGMRGAGANFGVVTSFEFRMHPVGPMLSRWLAAYPIDRAAEIAARFGEFAVTGPDEVMPTLLLRTAGSEDPWPELVGRPIVVLGAVHCGALEDVERDLRPLRLEDPLSESLGPESYLTIQSLGDEANAWGKRVYTKGGFVDEITEKVMDVCVEQIATAPGPCNIGFWAQGGAIARVPEEATAFMGRHAAMWVGAEAMWEDPGQDDAFREWGRRAWDALTPFTTTGHYVNDVVETGEGIVKAIYGPQKYERLVELKRSYDPDNLFRLNQNIRP